jgi:hypothetical protein
MTTTVLLWLLRCTTPTLEQEVFLTPPACYDRLASYARQCEVPTSDTTYRERCLEYVIHCSCLRRDALVLEPKTPPPAP